MNLITTTTSGRGGLARWAPVAVIALATLAPTCAVRVMAQTAPVVSIDARGALVDAATLGEVKPGARFGFRRADSPATEIGQGWVLDVRDGRALVALKPGVTVAQGDIALLCAALAGPGSQAELRGTLQTLKGQLSASGSGSAELQNAVAQLETTLDAREAAVRDGACDVAAQDQQIVALTAQLQQLLTAAPPIASATTPGAGTASAPTGAPQGVTSGAPSAAPSADSSSALTAPAPGGGGTAQDSMQMAKDLLQQLFAMAKSFTGGKNGSSPDPSASSAGITPSDPAATSAASSAPAPTTAPSDGSSSPAPGISLPVPSGPTAGAMPPAPPAPPAGSGGPVPGPPPATTPPVANPNPTGTPPSGQPPVAIGLPGTTGKLVIPLPKLHPIAGGTGLVIGGTANGGPATSNGGQANVSPATGNGSAAVKLPAGIVLTLPSIPVHPAGSPPARLTSVSATVQGVVRADTGAPVPGAVVVIAGKQAETNAVGVFEVSGVPVGQHTLAVTAHGFQQGRIALTLERPEVEKVSLVLHRAAAAPPALAPRRP